jgi:hypothetical protein
MRSGSETMIPSGPDGADDRRQVRQGADGQEVKVCWNSSAHKDQCVQRITNTVGVVTVTFTPTTATQVRAEFSGSNDLVWSYGRTLDGTDIRTRVRVTHGHCNLKVAVSPGVRTQYDLDRWYGHRWWTYRFGWYTSSAGTVTATKLKPGRWRFVAAGNGGRLFTVSPTVTVPR